MSQANEQYKIAEFVAFGKTTRVYILQPGQCFERFGGSSAGLVVRKTPSLIVQQDDQFGRNDIEFDVHDKKAWNIIFEHHKQSCQPEQVQS